MNMSEVKTKKYARIVKDGIGSKGKQRYVLLCDGCRVKTSIDPNKLKKHPIYNRDIDLSAYKCVDCIYHIPNKSPYTRCSAYKKEKFTPQSCTMFNFSEKFWRKLDSEI